MDDDLGVAEGVGDGLVVCAERAEAQAGGGGGEVVAEASGADGGAVDDGERCRVAPDQGPGDGAGGSACAPEQRAFAGGVAAGLFERALEAGDVGVVALQMAVVVDDGVDRADETGGLVEAVHVADDGFLVGDGDVCAERVGFAEALDEGGELVGGGVPGFVAGVEVDGVEGGLLEAGGDAVGDGASDHADAGGLPVRHLVSQLVGHGDLQRSMLAWCSS